MDERAVRSLLLHAEQHDIDFKRTFPPNYFGERGPLKDAAVATLVKDVAAMANAVTPGPGYLIYGVADIDGKRMPIPRDASEKEDEARLRQILSRYLDPLPDVWYGEFSLDGCVIGIFKVERNYKAPHVIKESLGNRIYVGQVYMREGTTTKVALSLDLKRLAQVDEPYRTRIGSRAVERFCLELQASGWRTMWVRAYDVDDKIAEGAQLIYLEGTRRPYVAPGNFDGTDPMYLMKIR